MNKSELERIDVDGTIKSEVPVIVESTEVVETVEVEEVDYKKVSRSSQITSKRGEHPKFIEINVMLLSSNILPYYAEFNTFINYFETTTIPTCGVNVSNQGMNFYWNRKFVDSLIEQEALFLILHEDFHLLFNHSKRSIIYNKELSNIAQDMIINQIILDEMIKDHKLSDKIAIPKQHDEFKLGEDKKPLLDKDGNKIKNPYFDKNMGLFIPKDYPGEPIFENLFQWLREKQDEHRKRREQQKDQEQEGDEQGKGQPQPGDGDQQGDGNGKGQPQDSDGKGKSQSDGDQEGDGQGNGEMPKDSAGNPAHGPYGKGDVECGSLDSIFDSMEKGEQVTLDSHIDDDIPENARKSIVNDFMQRLKNRGLQTSDVENILNKLRKTKKDYLKQIKRTISHHVFGSSKRKSITRPNRRGIEGIKGKKKYKNVINCLLDTSGSMCGDFEKVLSYIFQNDIHINLLQIDTKVKSVTGVKSKRDLQKIIIKGMGGTELQPGIEFINDPVNKLNSFNTVILTDGYTDTLNFTQSRGKVLILTTGRPPKYSDPKDIVKCIVIDTEKSLNS